MKYAVVNNGFGDSSDSDDSTVVDKRPNTTRNRQSLKESEYNKNMNLMRKRAELYNL